MCCQDSAAFAAGQGVCKGYQGGVFGQTAIAVTGYRTSQREIRLELTRTLLDHKQGLGLSVSRNFDPRSFLGLELAVPSWFASNLGLDVRHESDGRPLASLFSPELCFIAVVSMHPSCGACCGSCFSLMPNVSRTLSALSKLGHEP